MTGIKIVHSGSSSNGYILESGGQSLILELGCRMMDYTLEIKDAFNTIKGCIASHYHTDHLNKSTAKEFIRRGIPVFVGEKVYEELLKEGSIRGIKPLPMAQKTFIGGFTVQPFETPHNVPNYGFLIETPTKERIVFVTDAMYCNYNFKNLDCIMVECNHDDDTLIDNFVNAEQSRSHPEHHMGLEDCIDFCKRNTSVTTKQIILIHMSHTNINETYAMKQVSLAVPHALVSVAHSGDTFEIESDNF